MSINILLSIIVTSLATYVSRFLGVLSSVKIKETSKICGQRIKNIDFPRSAIIGGVIRSDTGIIALGDFKIQSGDRVVVCCLPQSIKKVESLFY